MKLESKSKAGPEPEQESKGMFHMPTLADLGEFALNEFREGFEDVGARWLEAWDGRSHRDDQRVDDPFAHRWSASDHARQHEDRDHPHELDFDR